MAVKKKKKEKKNLKYLFRHGIFKNLKFPTTILIT